MKIWGYGRCIYVPKAVVCMVFGNSFDATEMPCRVEIRITHTVSMDGEIMVFSRPYTDEKGTRKESQSRVQHCAGNDVRYGPEHYLQSNADDNVKKDHASFAKSMRGLGEE